MADIERDEQDQAEVFDETHLDDDGDGDLAPDEADPVMDVTQLMGDADDDDDPSDERPLEDELALSGVEAEADSLLGEGAVERRAVEDDNPTTAPDEIELVYSGLMRNQRGAQSSAAHWEAKRLSDDDIEALGYGPDDEQRV